MKSGFLLYFTLVAVTAALAIPVGLAAQDSQNPKHSKHLHYKLVDTGTLGGPWSSLGFEGERDINNRGIVVSSAETTTADPYAPDCFLQNCFVAHAVAWKNGDLVDLGALPTVNNSGPVGISDSGLIGGLSENGAIDPLTGFPEFEAVLFENGKMKPLGTFGGYESVVAGVNDYGWAVGCATNNVSDSFGGCFTSQQSRAFLWRNGQMRDLKTLGGPDAFAELVNDHGEIAGWSLTNSKINPTTGTPTQHPFLWNPKTRKMRDLGTIGGTAGVQINGLNNHGQVAGGMNVAGDNSYHPFLWDGNSLRDLGTFGGAYGSGNWINEAGEVIGWAWESDGSTHPFLWKHGALKNLGAVSGDSCGVAYVINSSEQIVGGADDCQGNNALAFIWENGSIEDLNRLVQSGPKAQLIVAVGLNDKGEIAAQGLTPDGDLHAYLLMPCDENHPGIEGCDYSMK
jgi:probable HAF family extracellular repeat protein